MARKKQIEDDKLIQTFEEYLIDECHADIQLFKLPKFGQYLRNNGYPNLADASLRRNTVFREHLERVKEKYEDEGMLAVLTYKTLDVVSFLRMHPSPESLKKGLVKLNDHHKRIAEAAILFKKEVDSLQMEKKKLLEQINLLENEITSHNEWITNSNILKEENVNLRNLIKTSVYPEIANELLKADGLLKTDSSIIHPDYIANQVLTADSEINFHKNVDDQAKNKSQKVVRIKNLLDSKTNY
ncbi:TPA: hypothetical protein ACGO3O_001342 [Streptococcus suis]